MAKKILVAYASRCGSTGEIAEAVEKELCAVGAVVDVKRVQDIQNINGYDALVLGAPARMGKLVPEAVKFALRNQDALQRVPTAYFAAGATLIIRKILPKIGKRCGLIYSRCARLRLRLPKKYSAER